MHPTTIESRIELQNFAKRQHGVTLGKIIGPAPKNFHTNLITKALKKAHEIQKFHTEWQMLFFDDDHFVISTTDNLPDIAAKGDSIKTVEKTNMKDLVPA